MVKTKLKKTSLVHPAENRDVPQVMLFFWQLVSQARGHYWEGPCLCWHRMVSLWTKDLQWMPRWSLDKMRKMMLWSQMYEGPRPFRACRVVVMLRWRKGKTCKLTQVTWKKGRIIIRQEDTPLWSQDFWKFANNTQICFTKYNTSWFRHYNLKFLSLLNRE